jgi:hypothetical protein
MSEYSGTVGCRSQNLKSLPRGNDKHLIEMGLISTLISQIDLDTLNLSVK